uniref:Uncharacterized protein n=1 Tax=Anopheles christyi TaxID=43041 RepID=A0A182JPI3_9DIPT
MPNITSLLLGGNRLTVFPAVYGKYPNIHISINFDPLLCDSFWLFKEKIPKYQLVVDQLVSSSCAPISDFLDMETIQRCCGNCDPGLFLQRITNMVDTVIFLNYCEAAFNLPGAYTIDQIITGRAPTMRSFAAGSEGEA